MKNELLVSAEEAFRQAVSVKDRSVAAYRDRMISAINAAVINGNFHTPWAESQVPWYDNIRGPFLDELRGLGYKVSKDGIRW